MKHRGCDDEADDLAAVGFERYAKTTRRAAFLAEMERAVPWAALCGLIEPVYPKPFALACSGRSPAATKGRRFPKRSLDRRGILEAILLMPQLNKAYLSSSLDR